MTNRRPPAILLFALLPLAGASRPAGARNPADAGEFAACRRALDRVAYAHWNWPAAHAAPKPPFETLLPEAAARRRSDDALRMAAVLAAIDRPIEPEDLQRELERMRRESRDPARLDELLAALGDDPGRAAWCLAMPALAEQRLRATWREDREGAARATTGAAAADAFESWWAERRMLGDVLKPEPPAAVRSAHTYRIPDGSDAAAAACDTWSAIPFVPEKRTDAVAIWTGSEMVMFGGRLRIGADEMRLRDAVAYDPATSVWRIIGAAGSGRSNAVAVWNGQAMVVVGGVNADAAGTPSFPEFGVLVNPTANTVATFAGPSGVSGLVGHAASLITSPTYYNGAVFVFGGNTDPARGAAGRVNALHVYDIALDSWTSPVYTGTPAAREMHSMVTIGTTIYVWGGLSAAGTPLLSGYSYTPGQSAWTLLGAAGGPSARYNHAAAVVSNKMMIWGGQTTTTPLGTGALYTPGAGWSTVSTSGAPAARTGHTLVIDGGDAYVWGGDTGGGTYVRSGGRYLSGSDAWEATQTVGVNVPEARAGHVAIHTGARMVVWGGQGAADQLQTGGRYVHAPSPAWTTTNSFRPESRLGAPAVWTGSQLWSFGGRGTLGGGTPAQMLMVDGFAYTAATGVFTRLPASGAPAPRLEAQAVWTGTGMAVGFGWDGTPGGGLAGPGGFYDGGAWSAFPSDGRRNTALAWSGADVLWWGGCSGDELTCYNTGYRWNPGSGVRTPLAVPAGSTGREHSGHAWSGAEWALFGGCTPNAVAACVAMTNNLYLYNPASGAWRIGATSGAPAGRAKPVMFWDGTGFGVWSGASSSAVLTSGYRYDPVNNAWQPLSSAGYAGAGTTDAAAVFTGGDLLIFDNSAAIVTDHFETLAQAWRRTAPAQAPPLLNRTSTPWAWTGSGVIVWAGEIRSGGTTLHVGASYSHDMPALTAQPADQSVCAPAGASFASGATNQTGLQWYENGSALADGAVYSGTATATLTRLSTPVLPPATLSRYAMAARNACGTANSRAARLDIGTAPSPATQLRLAKGPNLSLSWNAGSGATSYNVRGCLSLPCASPGTPSCIITGPTSCDADAAAPERFFWVESANSCGVTP